MTYPYDPSGDSTKDVAKDEALTVKDTAASAGQSVADTAKSQVQNVAAEATQQAKGLLDQGMSQAKSQLNQGQQQLATGVRALVDELNGMVSQGSSSGPIAQIAGNLTSRGENIASWLETHEPADALDEVRRFAARRPWVFLAGAAGAGLLVGRFARGTRELAVDDRQTRQLTSSYTTAASTQPVSYDEGYASTQTYSTDYAEPRYGEPTYSTTDAGYATSYPADTVSSDDATVTTSYDPPSAGGVLR